MNFISVHISCWMMKRISADEFVGFFPVFSFNKSLMCLIKSQNQLPRACSFCKLYSELNVYIQTNIFNLATSTRQCVTQCSFFTSRKVLTNHDDHLLDPWHHFSTLTWSTSEVARKNLRRSNLYLWRGVFWNETSYLSTFHQIRALY